MGPGEIGRLAGDAPGAFMVARCETDGGVCSPLLGENTENCPGDCLDPETHVKPYFSLAASCPKTAIFRPSSVEEAQAAMRLSVAQGKHVRVVGTVHTGSKAVCVENGNVISTQYLSRILGIETYKGRQVVHVQAGALIWEVAEYLHARGKALG